MKRTALATITICLIIIGVSMSTGGCTIEVPPGHVGMCRTVSGFGTEVLAPGRHTCWNRDKMFLLEISDKMYNQKMSVLCKDQLNLKFSVGVLAAVNTAKTDLIIQAFQNLTPAGGKKKNIITAKQLYFMYVGPVVDQEARKVVSKYETGEIVKNRLKIIGEVKQSITQAITAGIMKAKRTTVNNTDFPKSITAAQEKKAEQRVAIETEKAKQKKRQLIEENKLKIAQIRYKRKLVEAAAIADENKIIGSSVSPGFLAYYQFKTFSEAAKGPNNWGFIPYNDFTGKMGNSLGKSAMDAALLSRLKKAQRGVPKPIEKTKK